MRLSDSIQFQTPIREIVERRMSASEMADMIFSRTVADGRMLANSSEAWAKVHLASAEFVLMAVPLNLLAAPRANQIHASSITEEPIVVDLNRNRIGHTFKGSGPSVIVIDGVERFHAASVRGDSRIQTWIGIKAGEALGLISAGGPGSGPHGGGKIDMAEHHAVLISHGFTHKETSSFGRKSYEKGPRTIVTSPNGSWSSRGPNFKGDDISLGKGQSLESMDRHLTAFKDYGKKSLAGSSAIRQPKTGHLSASATTSRTIDHADLTAELLEMEVCACELAAKGDESQVETNNLGSVVGASTKYACPDCDGPLKAESTYCASCGKKVKPKKVV